MYYNKITIDLIEFYGQKFLQMIDINQSYAN